MSVQQQLPQGYPILGTIGIIYRQERIDVILDRPREGTQPIETRGRMRRNVGGFVNSAETVVYVRFPAV